MSVTHYNRFFRLKEEDFEPPDENFVQRVWFEQLYQNPLRTTDGRKIEIVQPGFWNRGAGPDFYHACVRHEGGSEEKGAVEIHLSPLAWKQHGHDGDPHYNRVILHVFWNSGPRDFFAGTREHHLIPQVELSGQLRFPARELRRQFQSTPEECKTGARIGRCNRSLEGLSNAAVENLLKDAGLCRFEEKCRLFQMRRSILGREQALWIGLAGAMGYAGNTSIFHSLAQRLPVRELLRHKEDVEREARLFGLAGLLPGRTVKRSGGTYLKDLWQVWWKERAALEDQIAPRKIWNLRGVRPLNHPERRLAVLALLSSGKNWGQFLTVAAEGRPVELRDFMNTLQHPFWSRHYTFESRIAGRPLLLIGESRLTALLFNTIWPYAVSEGTDVNRYLHDLRAPQNNRSNRTGRLRLLAGRCKLAGLNSLLVQEGLIQIHHDFCLKDTSQCRDCCFPERVEAMAGFHPSEE